MKTRDYKKLMNAKQKRRVAKRNKVLANAAVTGLLLTSAVVAPATLLWARTTVKAAIASADLFTNTTTSHNGSTMV